MRNGWVETTLNSFLKQSKLKVKVHKGEIYPAIGVMMEGRGFVTREPFVGGKTTYKFLTPIKPNQLVLRSITAWEAPIQVTSAEHDGFHVSGVFPVFDIDSSIINPRFLALHCQYNPFWEFMRERTVGSVLRRKTLSASALTEIPISLPPLVEQKRIVDLISSVDSYIEALKQQVDKARKSRNAVLHELITKGGDGWVDFKFKDVAKVLKGKLPKGKNELGIGLPYLTANYLRSNSADFWIENLEGAVIAEQGECLILWDGAGAGDLFQAQNGVVSSTMAVVKSVNDSIFRDFLTLLISTKADYIKETCRGTTVPHVSPDAIENMNLIIPPLAEQKRIVEIISVFDNQIEALDSTIAKTKNLRSALLSDLLSGNHEIPPNYDKLIGAA